VLHTLGLEGVVGRKSVSYYNRQSVWHRMELRRVYRETGMMEPDWVMGVYGDTGEAEKDRVMGGVFLGDSGVDSLH
jgi:hypothetical protein